MDDVAQNAECVGGPDDGQRLRVPVTRHLVEVSIMGLDRPYPLLKTLYVRTEATWRIRLFIALGAAAFRIDTAGNCYEAEILWAIAHILGLRWRRSFARQAALDGYGGVQTAEV